jgi:hypothetical protein
MLEFITNKWTLLSAGGLLTGAFAAVWIYAPGIGAWLLGSRGGRILLGIVFLLFILLVFISWVFAKGREKERLAEQMRNLEVLRSRIRTDSEVKSMPVEKRKEYLKSWSRD